MSRAARSVATSLMVLAAAVSGCGGSATVDTQGEVAVGHMTMRDPDVAFTFEYPTDFREATAASTARANALVVVGPAANGYLAVRLNGMRELDADALERQARAALGGEARTAAREIHSRLPMVVVTVDDTGGAQLGLRSTLYGFSLAGRSWLLECHSSRAQRAIIAAACRQAVGSIRLAPGASATAPSVAAEPSRVAPGATLTLVGNGWPADVSVQLLVGPPRSEAAPVAGAETDAEGTFRVSASVPRLAGPQRLVVLACRRQCRVKATTAVSLRAP